MKIDLYTKIILTVIAIGALVPILTNPPVTNKASAFVGGGGEMILNLTNSRIYHLKDSKVRVCLLKSGDNVTCGKWSN